MTPNTRTYMKSSNSLTLNSSLTLSQAPVRSPLVAESTNTEIRVERLPSIPTDDQAFQVNVDHSSPVLTKTSSKEPPLCTKPTSTCGRALSSITNGRYYDSSDVTPSYMRSKLQEIENYETGLSFGPLDEESISTLLGLRNSSPPPPPESSSPCPQSSPPPEYSPFSGFYSNALQTIYEEGPTIDPALLHDSHKFFPDSPDHESLGSDDTISDDGSSSQSSATTNSIHSSSDTNSSSPMDAHTTNLLHERNEDFPHQLHRLLLAVIEERKSKSVLGLQGGRRFITEEPGRVGTITECELMRGVDNTKSPPCWTGSTRSERSCDRRRCTAPVNGSQTTYSRIYLGRRSPLISSSSTTTTDRDALIDNEYDPPGSDTYTQVGKLRFSSPSPSQAHLFKRRKSSSPQHIISRHRPLKHEPEIRRIQKTSISSSPSAQEGTPTPKAPAPTYRIIKRASSFLASRRKATEDLEEPFNKRVKTSSNHTTRRTDFAKRPASLRRAASLRSETGTNDEPHTPRSDLVPTAPCTPQEHSPIVDHSSTRRRFCREQRVKFPFPIVLPPIDYIMRLPISTETAAKRRLQRLLEREQAVRQQDGLWAVNLGRASQSVMIDDSSSTESNTDGETEDEEEPDSGSIWDSVLGIGAALRDDIIDWTLNVLPEPEINRKAPSAWSSSSCSAASSTSSSNSFSTVSSTIESVTSNLLDQLATSPETRFHAAYMFLRYFYLIRAAPGSPSWKADREDDLSEDGFELVAWDVAVGCLALSVKYHRDFLEPLLPVYAHEFQEISPHHISYEDLESSQRDLLAAFSYSLGITPQGILDELWLALPSLRQLFDFTGGWNCVLKETWWRLFEAILEPDVLRFPVSLLTAGALVNAIVESLMLKYEYDAGWRVEVTRRRRPGYVSTYAATSTLQLRRRRERRAESEAEGVIQDIQAVLGVTDVRLSDCRRWLRK